MPEISELTGCVISLVGIDLLELWPSGARMGECEFTSYPDIIPPSPPYHFYAFCLLHFELKLEEVQYWNLNLEKVQEYIYFFT